MFTIFKEDKKTLLFILATTFIVGFIAHAHAYLNLFLNHDSLFVQHNNSHAFLDSHGRFFIKYWTYIIGGATLPFIHGIFSLIFITLSSYFIVKILDLKNNFSIFAICGIFATSPILTFSNATYVFFSDLYMLAMFLSIVSVYIFRRTNFIFATPFLVCSLGIYQSYIQVATTLLLILLIKNILDKHSFKDIIKNGIMSLLLLASSICIYYIIIKYFNTQELSSYQNYNSIGSYSGIDIVSLLKACYLHPLKYLFVRPYILATTETLETNFLSYTNYFIATLTLMYLSLSCLYQKVTTPNILLIGMILFVMPFAMNFISFASKQNLHDLTLTSIYCFYVLAIFSMEYFKVTVVPIFSQMKLAPKLLTCVNILFVLAIIFPIHSNIIFANQVYVYKDLHFTSSLSLMTRVVDRMEQTEGYEHGKTKVLFIGQTMFNKYFNSRLLIDRYDPIKQHFMHGTVTYNYQGFLNHILNLDIPLLDSSYLEQVKSKEEVEEMLEFPHKNSVKMVDDILFVKISN